MLAPKALFHTSSNRLQHSQPTAALITAAVATTRFQQGRRAPLLRCRKLLAAADSDNSAASDPLPALRAWVAAAGGYVDPRLTGGTATARGGGRV